MASDQSKLFPVLRILFWLLLLLFVSSSLFWICFFPYAPERVYAAIPPGAVFLTRHENLAERWPEFVEHPVVKNAVKTMGGSEELLDSLNDPATVKLVQRIASRTTVLGYVPGSRAGETGLLVVSSWLGMYAQFLEWGFLDKSLSGFERVDLDDGVSLWLSKSRMMDSDLSLSFCVFEGVLVACISDNPLAVAGLRHRLKMGSAHAGVFQKASGGPDAAWIMAPGIQDRLSGKTAATLHISALRENAIEISVLGNTSWRQAGRCDYGDVPDLGSLFRRPPDLFASFCMSEIRNLLSPDEGDDSSSSSLAPLLERTSDAAPVFVWMSGGDYSGRLLKLKVPTIIAGTAVREDTDVEELISVTLDRLNARHDWGLIPRKLPEMEPPVFVIEGTRAGGVTIVNENEKPAVTIWKDWLLVSSNVGTLTDLMDADWRSRLSGNRRNDVFWINDLLSREASGYARLEMGSSVTTLKNAKAVYELALILGDSPEHQKSVLDDADVWLDALNCLGTCSIWMNGRQEGLEFVFKLEAGTPAFW